MGLTPKDIGRKKAQKSQKKTEDEEQFSSKRCFLFWFSFVLLVLFCGHSVLVSD
jgi:lipopolysaccharide/colanic/teichoic acid biosynthesis glycosyltransferase